MGGGLPAPREPALPPRAHLGTALDADTVVVGLDDFARRLLGPARGVKLPALGDWLRQGEQGFGGPGGRPGSGASRARGGRGRGGEPGRSARHPTLATDDPYGRGWILKVRAANLAANLRNLLSGRLARRWMEDSREGLDLRLMALSGSVLQDGGEPMADFARHLSARGLEAARGRVPADGPGQRRE